MEDRLFYVGQKTVIEKTGKILILHDPQINAIDLPGGKIQVGETDFKQALKREVKEETGLTIEIGQPFSTGYFEFKPKSTHRNKGKQIYLIFFKCRYISGKIKLSEEHDWYKWVDKKSYHEYNPKGNILHVLEIYFQSNNMVSLSKNNHENEELLTEITTYLKKFDFQVARLIQKKFKIGFSRAEKIIKEIRRQEL